MKIFVRCFLLLATIVSLSCSSARLAPEQAMQGERQLEQAVQSSTQRNVVVNHANGWCSGVIYETNFVITAKHCNMPPLFVNGIPASIARIGDKEDLMLLMVATVKMDRLEFNLAPSAIEQVFSVGNPGMKRNYVDFGRITQKEPENVTTSFSGAPGTSGGGIYSYDGRLVGIGTGFYGVPTGPNSGIVLCGNVVPSEKVKAFIEGSTLASSK